MKNNTNIKIKKLQENINIPKYQTIGSSGLDIESSEDKLLEPNSRTIIKSGFAMEIPIGFEAQIRPRSGLTLKGIDIAFGTIDSDYRGEIGIIVINNTPQSFKITKSMRIAQMIIAKIEKINIIEVKEIDETKRSIGGFGSTGY